MATLSSGPTMTSAYGEVIRDFMDYLEEAPDKDSDRYAKWNTTWLAYMSWGEKMDLECADALEQERKLSLKLPGEARSEIITILHDLVAAPLKEAVQSARNGTYTTARIEHWLETANQLLKQLYQLTDKIQPDLTKQRPGGERSTTPMPQGGYGSSEGEDTEVESSRKGKGKAKKKGKAKSKGKGKARDTAPPAKDDTWI